MTSHSSSKLQLSAIPFSLLGAVFSFFSYFLLGFLDNVVHGDLYGYGLVFSYEWASNYWESANLIRSFLLIITIITIIAIIAIIIQVLTNKNVLKYIGSSFFVINIFFMLFSIFLLTRLDSIVNNTLYSYGLQFSYDWSGQYWNYIVFIFGFFIASIMTYIVSVGLLLTSNSFYESRFFAFVKSFFKINSIFLFSGIIILYFSISFNSSILSFIGLGLLFWGAILFFIRSDSYVNENLLNPSIKPALLSLEQLVSELEYEGPGIYLPPKYLKDFDSSKLFISKSPKTILPTTDQTQNEDNIMIQKPKGLLLTPIGYGLSKLFEETLRMSFIQMDLLDVEINLRKLLVEDLEVAQNVQIQMAKNIIYLRVEKSIYNNLGTLSSAFGCIFAKSSGKPIKIVEKKKTEDKQINDFYYQIIENDY